MLLNRSVTFAQQGREGQATYHEGLRSITGYQEFGGGDVVAILSMGDLPTWRANHAWAVDRRAEILRFVADEAIRQRAPTCVAEIDESRGDILIRESKTGSVGAVLRSGAASVAAAAPADVSWVSRYFDLRGKFALIVLGVVLVVGVLFWLKTRVFVVQGGKGVPMGSTLRTDTHLATLIQQLQPYTPSLHHDPSIERNTLSVFLVPLDGSTPRLVRLVRDLRPGSYSLAHVIGSEGGTLWIEANGDYGVDLQTYAVLDGAHPPTTLERDPFWSSTPPLTLNMAAGVRTPDGHWLGAQSSGDLEAAYRVGRWLRSVESASDRSVEMRRLMHGELEPEESSAGGSRRIRSMTPVSEAQFRNASFLRVDEKSEPLRLAGPDSVLMMHSSGDGAMGQGTLLVSRIDIVTGRLLWTADTGLYRARLEQILAARSSTAFVGTRPPIPDKLSEPLIVILDHAAGTLQTHSRWQ